MGGIGNEWPFQEAQVENVVARNDGPLHRSSRVKWNETRSLFGPQAPVSFPQGRNNSTWELCIRLQDLNGVITQSEQPPPWKHQNLLPLLIFTKSISYIKYRDNPWESDAYIGSLVIGDTSLFFF
jgi:hypothetical protein